MHDNDPFNNIQLASYKPTYVGLPMDQYEKSANLLENKYFQNRDQADKIQMAVSQADVQDKNKPIVNALANDISNDLSQAKEQWQFAGDIIRNTLKKTMTNPLFNAAIEDRKKEIANSMDQKARLEKGDITETMQVYGNIIDKLNNQNPLTLDPLTQTINNRWTGTSIPKYVDKEKMALEIAKNLPETYEGMQRVLPGMPAGYFAQIKGKAPEIILAAVHQYLDSNDQVQAYDEFINKGKAISTFAQQDPETNKIGLRMPMNEDYRNIGVDVDEDGVMHNNQQITKKGKTITQDFPRQLLTENDTLEHRLGVYAVLSKAHDNDAIANLASLYANKEVQIHKDEMFFHLLKLKEEKQQNVNVLTSNSPLLMASNLDYSKSQDNIKSNIQHLKDLEDIKNKGGNIDQLDYIKTKSNIQSSVYRQNMIADQYSNSKDGNDWINSSYTKFIKDYPGFNKITPTDFKDYLIGTKEIPESLKHTSIADFSSDLQASIQMSKSTNALTPASERINSLKQSLSSNINSYTNSTPISLQATTISVYDKSGKVIPGLKAASDMIATSPGAFKIMMNNDKGDDMTVSELQEKHGINTNLYDYKVIPASLPNGTTQAYLSITPKQGVKFDSKIFPKGATYNTLINIDDPNVASSFNTTINKALVNTKDPQALNYVYNSNINNTLGSAFNDATMEITRGNKPDGIIEIPRGQDTNGKPQSTFFNLTTNPNYLKNDQPRYKLSTPTDPSKYLTGNSLQEIKAKVYNLLYAK